MVFIHVLLCTFVCVCHGIAGASSGIGKATALDLALRGARLILACRNEEKTARVIREIQATVEGAVVSYRHLDLARLQSVRDFAERFNREESCLDILINNAGTDIGKSLEI